MPTLSQSNSKEEQDPVPPVDEEGEDTAGTTSSRSRTAGSSGSLSHVTHYKSHLIVLKPMPRVTHLMKTLASYSAVGLPFSHTIKAP
jgi:hypothetical protein